MMTSFASSDSFSTGISRTAEGVVILHFDHIVSQKIDLSDSIDAAFGNSEDALGLVLVRGVPTFPQLRERMLKLATTFAALPKETKEKSECPDLYYQFGWSHGKELMNGKPDLAKGSYYANPLMDKPTEDAELIRKFPVYCSSNKWPGDDCPEFEVAFKQLGRCIVDTGKQLARVCDSFVSKRMPAYPPTYLFDTLSQSNTHKGRLLHYFPYSSVEKLPSEPTAAEDKDAESTWCGIHLDHSSITGLCSAAYIDEGAISTDGEMVEVDCPDPSAGLYIKSRCGKTVKVTIPRDCIAFQMGEALEVASSGCLRATPHWVKGLGTSFQKSHSKLARNTFACFMQPAVDNQLIPGYSFADFTLDVLNRHY